MGVGGTAPAAGGATGLIVLDEVDSTNSEAMRRALAGAEAPLWIRARRQTAGRGRAARAWASLPGNLSASLLLRLDCPVAAAAQLSLVAGVAAIDAIRAAAPAVSADVRLKWPNDVLAGAGKLGGILVESSRDAGLLVAVVGFGINVRSAPQGLARPVASLAGLGAEVAAATLLTGLGEAMTSWLRRWDEGRGFAEIRAAWIARAGPEGEPLTVHDASAARSGRFAGLDADGALLLAMDDGHIERVAVGDVTLAGETPPRDTWES